MMYPKLGIRAPLLGLAGTTVRVSNAFRRMMGDRSGNVAIVFCIAIIPILAAIGISIDFTRASNTKAHLDSTVDSTALSIAMLAAADPNAPNFATEITKAQTIFTSMAKSTADLTIAPVTVNVKTDPSDSSTILATVAYTASLNTTIGSVFMPKIDISGTATAVISKPGGICITTIDKSAVSFIANGATINGPDCVFNDWSIANPAAIFNGSTVTSAKFCIAGASDVINGASVTNHKTSCTVSPDPYVAALPSVSLGSCYSGPTIFMSSTTLQPGTYCGDLIFNGFGTITLKPGLYILQNSTWIINGPWRLEGTDVTFYFADSNSVLTNNGSTLWLSAPTSGAYQNLLMFEPQGLPKTQMILNGVGGHNFAGLFYLPSRDIILNGVTNSSPEYVSMWVNTIIVNGGPWNIAAAKPLANGSPPATVARLMN